MNLADVVTQKSRLNARAPAVLVSNRVISYAEFDNLVWKAAVALRQMRIGSGDVVAISMGSQLMGLITMLATARIGAVAFSWPKAMPVSQKMELGLKAGVQRILSDKLAETTDIFPTSHLDLGSLAESRAPFENSIRESVPAAPFLLIAGSGSTGAPKIFALSHAEMLNRARLTAASIQLGPMDRILSVSNLDFTSPKERSFAALSAGAAVALIEGETFDPVSLCHDMGITVMNATVFHLETMLKSLPDDAVNVLGSLRVLQVGASTVTDSLRRRVVQKICRSLHVRYGTNESGLISLAYPDELFIPPGNVGRPSPNVTDEIVDRSGLTLPRGQTGHIRVKSPGMIQGYMGDDSFTNMAFRDGWFYTGDLGAITSTGQLLHLGRSDHMMITNGVNIYPAEIEHVLSQHPVVRDVAALPLKSEVHQDIPVCAVTIDPTQQVHEDTLIAFAREKIGSRAPVAIAILDAIPRNEQGKLIRAEATRAIVAKIKSRRLPSGKNEKNQLNEAENR